MGNGADQVVSVLAFHSNNPSSNPAVDYSFFFKFVLEKNESKHKEAGVGPFKKILNQCFYLADIYRSA